MVERSRGAEAKDVLGSLRKQALAYYMQTYSFAGLLSTDAGLGTANDLAPSACRQSHFFSYTIGTPVADTITLTATRCTATGKVPNGTTSGNIDPDGTRQRGN